MPIRRKLMLIALVSAGAALLLASIIVSWHQWFVSHAELAKTTHSQAHIVASNSTSALLLNDPKLAQQNLETLSAFDNIEFVALYDRQGKLFASFVVAGHKPPPRFISPGEESVLTHTLPRPDSDAHTAPPADSHAHAAHDFSDDRLDVIHAIDVGRERVGVIYVGSSLSPAYQQMAWSAAVMAGSALAGLGLALLLIAVLHPAITGPMAALVGLMGRVSSEKNYALRADIQGKDEVAMLGREFNDMLSQIQARDAALAQHGAHLEQEVARRTVSLTEVQHIAHLGSWEWDIVNDILSWSDEIYRIFGLPPQQFGATYDAFMQFVHPDDRQPLEERLRQVLEQPGQAFSQDHRILLPDGSVRHVHEQGEASFDGDGRPIRMVGTVLDITEATLATEQIRKQQELTTQIIETIPMRVFWKDHDLRYLGCNTLFAKDAGLARPDELIGKTDFDMGWKDQAELYRADDRQVMESNTPKLFYDEPQTAPDGGRIWLRTSKVPLRNEANEVIGMLGVYEDITEYKQMELRMLESEQRFRNIAELTTDWVWQVDEHGTYTYSSANVHELLGYDPEEVVGKTPFDFMPPDEAVRIAEIFRDLASNQAPFSFLENVNLHKDGRRVILESSGVPLFGDDGVFQGFFGADRDITERKRTEDVLRESELAYRTLAQNLPGLVYRVFVREGHRMEAYNDMFPQVTGYTADELTVGEVCSIDPLILDEDRAGVVAEVTRALAEAGAFTVEYRLKHKNGGIRWVVEYGMPVYGADGAALYIEGVIFDITERKQDAQALEESERKFRAIVDAAADGILVTDGLTHKFVIANRAIGDMLGYPMEEVYRLGVADIHPAEALADVQKTFERQLNGEMLMAQNIPVKRKDGSVFFADISASPIILEGRSLMVGAFHDVTERMKAEERIRDSEERYRRIFEHANDIIFILNSDGSFRSLSPAFERVAGWTAEEWIGKPFVPIVHADDLPVANTAFHKALTGESISSFRLRIARKAGQYFSADLSLTPLGRDMVMGVARDVSERQRAEAEILKLNEELEGKVQERTRQLLEAQEDLVRKEKLAVLGQVAGSVGHELRNPLGVMSNAVYFLQTVLSDADETTREYLNIIKDEIADSERIVSDLLDSVRTKPPRPEAVSVAELIGQTLNKLTLPASVTITLDIPETLSPLQVDAQQIQQVFRNLISNGVEAMAEGGEMEIRAVENKPEGQVVVSVRDSGIGMTPEQMARLFQPLFTTKARGIGLGMVVVKNLTEANGGKVEIQSGQGRGTTVSITLPCVAQPVEEA